MENGMKEERRASLATDRKREQRIQRLTPFLACPYVGAVSEERKLTSIHRGKEPRRLGAGWVNHVGSRERAELRLRRSPGAGTSHQTDFWHLEKKKGASKLFTCLTTFLSILLWI